MTANAKTRSGKTNLKGRGAGKPASAPPAAGTSSKLDLILSMLGRPTGADLAELSAATGWQGHSVRGALAGALKKKGHIIRSEKHEGRRRYRLGAAQ